MVDLGTEVAHLQSARIKSLDATLAIEQEALIVECSWAMFSTLLLTTSRTVGLTLAPLKYVPAAPKRYLRLLELNVRVTS